MPEIQFNAFEAFLFSALALLLTAGLVKRIIKAEFRRKKCVFCGHSIPADEYSHHLEICGLRHSREFHFPEPRNMESDK